MTVRAGDGVGGPAHGVWANVLADEPGGGRQSLGPRGLQRCEVRCSVNSDLAAKLIKIGSVARLRGGGASRFCMVHSRGLGGRAPGSRLSPFAQAFDAIAHSGPEFREGRTAASDAQFVQKTFGDAENARSRLDADIFAIRRIIRADLSLRGLG